MPDRGVAGLQPAFHINRLLEVQQSLQRVENPAATPEGEVKLHKPSVQSCFEHHEEELRLYCQTCGELVCVQCIMKDGKHHDHDCTVLQKAFEKYKEKIASFLEPMEKQVMTIRKVLAQLDARSGEISDQRAVTEENIHVTFRRLREVLNVRETELVGRLHALTQEKLKDLAAQRDQIEATLAQLHSCLHYMRESLRPGNEGDVLLMKENTVRQVKELTTPDIVEPCTKADIAFSAPADMTAVCGNFGQIFSLGWSDPSKCHLKGKGQEVTTAVDETCSALLQAIDFEGKPCMEPMKSLECELVSEITGTRASCNVERRGQSQYEISYQPTIKGRHELHVRVQSQHIRGSPLSLAAKSPVKKLGDSILTINRVESPHGVAVNQRGEVLIAELNGDHVSVFSPSGEKLQSFGERGFGPGKFVGSRGVAVDGEGNILVTDHHNHRIQKFTAEGKFLAAVGTRGSGPLQFFYPGDVAFNPSNGMVYVVDMCNRRVQVLNSDLTFSSTFEEKGSEPWGIACDSTGKVYVSDRGNHRILVFTAEGKCIRKFGRRGQGIGEIDRPRGVAIDSNDMVYVSEGANRRVSVFTTVGNFVTVFGEGLGPGGAVAVDDNGVVYVCYSDCVGVF